MDTTSSYGGTYASATTRVADLIGLAMGGNDGQA